jgi:hypothetical protein
MPIPLHAIALSKLLPINAQDVRSASLPPVLLGSVVPAMPFKPLKAVNTTRLFGTTHLSCRQLLGTEIRSELRS